MDSEIIYGFDPATNEFTGEYTREINPKLQIDLTTRTRIPVLPPKEGFARVFNSAQEVWNYVEDCRGKQQYSIVDKSETKIDYLGAVKKGFTLDKPSEFDAWDAKTKKWVINIADQFDDAKINKRTEINAKRTEIELGGFESNGKTFDSDRDSIARISSAVTTAQLAVMSNQPFSVNWTVKDNSIIKLDTALMFDVQAALVTHVNATHEKARVLKDALEAAKTISELEAITW